MQLFSQKIVVITGAASGIGQALACKLDALGAIVALADKNEIGLQETREKLRRNKEHASCHALDVSDLNAYQQFVDDVIAAHGHVDMVINNAGVALSQTVEEMTFDDCHWIMNINFWGVVHGCKLFLPHLKTRPEAAIINISSLFGCIAQPTQSAYNASKFAVRGFTEALRQELNDSSVFVTCVHPGGIKTNIVRNGKMLASSKGRTTHEEHVKSFEKMAMTTADQAAHTIINGIQNHKRRIMIGTDAHLLEILQRLFPVRYTDILSWLLKKLS